MALSGAHTFICAVPDDPVSQAAGMVLPSHWNATIPLSGVASAAQGGTGSQFFGVTGPLALRAFTFPDADAAITYGAGSTTDKAIVRMDGTGGSKIQGYTSNTPTISDAGAASFPGGLTAATLTGSNLTSGAIPLAGTAGLLGDSLLTYSAVSTGPGFPGAGGSSVAHPSFMLGAAGTAPGINGSYTHTGDTSFRWLEFDLTITPTISQTNTGASNTAIKYRNLSTGANTLTGQTGTDSITFHGGTGTSAYVVGLSSTFGATSSGTVTNAVGVGSIWRATTLTTAPTFGNVYYFEAGYDGTPLNATISGNLYGYFVGGDGSGNGGLNIASPNSVTLTGDRAALFVGTMSGTPGGVDRAVDSRATQLSSWLGGHRVSHAAPPSFSNAIGTAINTLISGAVSLSAVASTQAVIGDAQFAMTTGTPGAFNLYGVSGISMIGSTDDRTHNAATLIEGGVFTAEYKGTGAGPNVVGSHSTANKTGAGTLATMTGSQSALSVTSNGGNVTTAVGYNLLWGFAATGALTVSAAKGLSIPRPTGGANTTFTQITGVEIANMTPATSAAISNPGIALTIASQTGAGSFALKQVGTVSANNLIFLGAKITTYANITTQGSGVPAIYGENISATKTADFTALTYTPPSAVGRYLVGATITTDANTNTGTIALTVDYVDSAGTTHTADIIPLTKADGTVVTSATAASKEFTGIRCLSVNNAGSNIVIKADATNTVSYTIAPFCIQIGDA